jgi:hypothetical protein
MMAGNYPCCCGEAGQIKQPCTDCNSYVLTISGIADEVPNPGNDIFGNPLPTCQATTLNGTHTGSIASGQNLGFYGLGNSFCGARDRTFSSGSGIANYDGNCGCTNAFPGSGYDLEIGFDIIWKNSVTFPVSTANPCYDASNPTWYTDGSWVEIDLWYRAYYGTGQSKQNIYRVYRYRPTTCLSMQTDCTNYSWTFSQANEYDAPFFSCGDGAIDTTNVSMTLTLGV